VQLLHAWLIAASLAMPAPAPVVAAGAAKVARAVHAVAPPRLLNIVRVKVKPHNGPQYAALESQIVRAYDRAKAKVYWIGLSDRDGTDVLYLNLLDSGDAWDRMTAAYDAMIKPHPEIADLQQRLAKLTVSSVSTMTRRRDDVDRPQAAVDFTSMRALRLTMVEVREGHEGAFLDAIRTSPEPNGSWLVYEANESSTYALLTLTKTKLTRKDGLAMPRSLRRSKGIVTKVETRLYTVRPAMSHPPPAAPAATQ
jgi:hypothetical protein